MRISFNPGNELWLVSLAFILAGLGAVRHLVSWPARLNYSGEDGSEGILLAEMLDLRQGVPIYGPPSPERFSAANYGPLYYGLGARVLDPQKPAFLPLRLLSFLSTLGCAAGCALLAFWLGRSYLAAALAPLVFLNYGIVTRFGSSARCDIAALFLFFAGFLIAYRFQKSDTILLATAPMVLGFFYKQQFIAGPLGVTLFLILEKRYRLAMKFAGLLALGIGGLLALFQFAVFPGQAFVQHLLLYNASLISQSRFTVGVLFFAFILLIPFLVALEFLRSNPNKLLGCYLGCAVLLSLVTVAREGSDTNYFLECVVLLSAPLSALFAKRIAETPRAVELLVLLVVSLFLGQGFAPPAPRAEDFVRDRAVQGYLRRNFAPHTPALGYYTGDLVRAGLDTPISNLYHYSRLIRNGVLSDRDLLAQLQEHRYGLIVLNFDLEREKDPNRTDYYLTESMRRAIREYYRLEASLEMPGPEKLRSDDRFYAWVPRASGAAIGGEREPVCVGSEGHP